MNTTQLEYFISVAELHSFTKAAQKHFVTQTAITQQIQLLEETVHAQLIDRKCRPIRLTAAGDTFLLEAKAIVERTRLAINKVQASSTGVAGTLSIGYIKGYERSNLSEKLRLFHRDYPNIFFTCHRGNNDSLLTGLISEEYDIIFTWNNTNILSPADIAYQTIEATSLSAVLYNGHPFAQRSFLSRKDLKDERFIYLITGNSYPSPVDNYYQNLYTQAGYEPDPVFYSDDVESVLMMVAAEEGISIMPSYITEKLINADNLISIPLIGELETEQIIAVWKKDIKNFALNQFLATQINDRQIIT